MNWLVFGTNYKTTPLQIRERMAVVDARIHDTLDSAHRALDLDCLVILSTCNRSEFIVLTELSVAEMQAHFKDWLAKEQSLEMHVLDEYLYCHDGETAIKHLLEVASGIDSMVMGEPQIFGQFKSALAMTEESKGLSHDARQFFQQVFYYAKKIRTDTAIGENPISVAYVAVQLSQQLFQSLKKRKVLLIGAGETIELVAKHMQDKGIQQIIVANRTLSRAQAVAKQFDGEAVLLSSINDCLMEVDIIISSTASQLPILGKGMVESALRRRRHKPFFMVDLAVPRDIEVEVSELEDVYLYSIDHLSEIVKENSDLRKGEARKADVIIHDAIDDMMKHARSMEAVDTLKAMREQAQMIQQSEIEKAMRQINKGENPEIVIKSLAHSLSNKLLHHPTVGVKQAAIDKRHDRLLWAKQLFGVDQSMSDDE